MGVICRAMANDFEWSEKFDAASLRSLVEGDINLIWHRGFHAQTDCQEALPRIVEECDRSSYTLTSDLQSLGTSMGEANESDENAKRYLATAEQTTRLIRDTIFARRRFPADTVRLSADEWWPAGAMIGKVDGQQMLPGIIRRWVRGGHANPHIDQREVPLLRHYRLRRRIGVNVYLEAPPAGEGGEIEFWDVIEDENAYLAMKRGDYGLERDSLGSPLFSVQPGQGDLVMFDAARIHGVSRLRSGSRVTAACFLGVATTADPLVIFA